MLLGATLYAVVTRRRATDNRRFEFVAAMACLHVAFVTLFFGHAWSWAYYDFLLVIGATAAVAMIPGRRCMGSLTVGQHWAVYCCGAVRVGSDKGCGEPQEA